MISDAEAQRQFDSNQSKEFTRCVVGKSKSKTAAFEYADIDTETVITPEEYEKRLVTCIILCIFRRLVLMLIMFSDGGTIHNYAVKKSVMLNNYLLFSTSTPSTFSPSLSSACLRILLIHSLYSYSYIHTM